MSIPTPCPGLKVEREKSGIHRYSVVTKQQRVDTIPHTTAEPEDQPGNFLGPEKRRRSIHPDAVSGLMALQDQDRRKLKTIPAAIYQGKLGSVTLSKERKLIRPLST